MEENELINYEEVLADTLSKLKKPEKAFIDDPDKELINSLNLCAKLIDEINANMAIVNTFPVDVKNNFTKARNEFLTILEDIAKFEIMSSGTQASQLTPQSIQNKVTSFKAHKYMQLLDIKSKILTINADTLTPEGLKKTN